MKELKYQLGCCLAALVLFASCNRGDAVTGTYASQESGEYSISRDTLVIIPYGDQGDYQVIRKSAFQTIRAGKLQATEHKIREYMGKYDSKLRVLLMDAAGKKITFFPGKNSLLLMQREYHKVAE
ncbi:hypothetical protein HQN86_24900 [Pedobacter panaciterrae]|uniref:hypothetical protein n=1 Tax=Pedobacter panaciterrae TaxID=363849 RepID=UPI00155DD605|nr:hypothetical protein [Pedobacter panaciterrae]NQX56880.1 hypothetical protein [Pedobacter panaciterrae]